MILSPAMQARRGARLGRKIGQWLRAREGRIIEGHKFERRGTAQGGVTRWGVKAGSKP